MSLRIAPLRHSICTMGSMCRKPYKPEASRQDVTIVSKVLPLTPKDGIRRLRVQFAGCDTQLGVENRSSGSWMNDHSILDSRFSELNRTDAKQFNFQISVYEVVTPKLRTHGRVARKLRFRD
jgi:hypothetical protein